MDTSNPYVSSSFAFLDEKYVVLDPFIKQKLYKSEGHYTKIKIKYAVFLKLKGKYSNLL